MVEEAKTADDPKLTEDKRQAEELVSFAYKLTEMKDVNDPVVMEEIKKIIEHRARLQAVQ